jgi:hypothetical protein
MSDESPNPASATHVHLVQSCRTWSALHVVAEALAAASETESIVYVERLGDLYRWSLATKGGGYPLLRITARFLDADYSRIYVGFRTLPDGTAILCEDPSNVDVPDRWKLLKLSEEITPTVAAWRIRTAVGGGDSRRT